MPMSPGQPTGLADRRIQADVGHQLVGRLEAGEVPDGGHDGHRDGHVNVGDGHQPQRVGVVEREPGQLAVDQFQLLAGEVQLT
jgi:hypothetical protein